MAELAIESILPGLEPLPLFPGRDPGVASQVSGNAVGAGLTCEPGDATDLDEIELEPLPEAAATDASPAPVRAPKASTPPPQEPFRIAVVKERFASRASPSQAPAPPAPPARTSDGPPVEHPAIAVGQAPTQPLVRAQPSLPPARASDPSPRTSVPPRAVAPRASSDPGRRNSDPVRGSVDPGARRASVAPRSRGSRNSLETPVLKKRSRGPLAVLGACVRGIRGLFVRVFLGPLGHLYISGDLSGPSAWKTVRDLKKKKASSRR